MKSRAVALVWPTAALLALSGCALVEPKTNETPPTTIELCAMGHTWQLELDDLAEKVLAHLQSHGVNATAVTATESQQLEWTEEGAATVTADFTVEATLPGPSEDVPLLVTQHNEGVIEGRAYINGSVTIPRRWNVDGFDSETVATIDGVEQETIPFEFPVTVLDDELGLETVCDGSTLTFKQRGRDLVQVWSRVS